MTRRLTTDATLLRFLIRRLLLTIPVVLGVATLVFSLIHLVPGDPAQAMLGESASPADMAELRAKLGLDRPLIVQYGRFLDRAGDRGSRDLAAHQPAGGGGDCRADARDRRAWRGGDDARHRACRAARHPGRGPRRHARRSRRHHARADRDFDAEFLAGAAAGDRLFGDAWLVAGLGPGNAGASGAAGGHAGRTARCGARADDARQRDRGTARALRPGRARAGRVAAARRAAARVSQQPDSHRDGARSAIRRRADRAR